MINAHLHPNRIITALVLGVGGNVSQGIVKALGLMDPSPRIVAACVSEHSAGLYLGDAAYISPYADDPGFIDWLFETCSREGVDVVLSGVEEVLEAIAPDASRLREETGAVAIVSPLDVLEIGRDKLRTAAWLREHGMPAPETVESDDRDAVSAIVEEFGFPLIAKPRLGKGSGGVITVNTSTELDCVMEKTGYVVQEHLGSGPDEFTVATFSDRETRIRGIAVMRRELAAGTTSVAELGEFPEFREAAAEVVAELAPLGPCNLQMRAQGSVPCCFEINVRFSSTAPIRAHYGFNDVEAAIRHYVLEEPAQDLPLVTEGTAIRLWEEVYPSANELRDIAEDRRLQPRGK